MLSKELKNKLYSMNIEWLKLIQELYNKDVKLRKSRKEIADLVDELIQVKEPEKFDK